MAKTLSNGQIQIEAGDTLSGIYGQNWKQLSGYAGDPTKLQIGTVLPAPTAPVAPVSKTTPIVATSDLARNKFNENTTTILPKMESQFVSKPQSMEGFSDFAKQKGFEINPQTGEVINPSQEIIDEFNKRFITTSGAISFKSDNPAFQNLIDQTNQLIKSAQESGTSLSPEALQKINDINNYQFQKTSSVAGARTAADNKDASVLDKSITDAKTADTSAQDAINSLMADLKTTRADYVASLTPNQAEIDLKQKLIDLRTERQLEPLALRAEGISALGIQGRQIDSERVRAILESNLLAEIGLETESRQMKSQGLKEQIGFISDDIQLQLKIQDILDQKEKDVVSEARNLSKESLSVLSNVVQSLNGLSWQDLDATTQSDIISLLKPYSDITIPLLSSALEVSKQQDILDKAKAGTTTSSTGANYNTRLNQEISNVYSDRYGIEGAREKAISILKNEFPSVDVAKDIYNRIPDNWQGMKTTTGGNMSSALDFTNL